jgi:hypothetical protein
MIKTNWDASIYVLNQRMGVGVIVCNEYGVVVALMCALVSFITDPAIAEGVALWRAVLLSLDLGIPRLHLEGNYLKIVQALVRKGLC